MCARPCSACCATLTSGQLNLPLVAPLLIASRTSLVDNLFTMMPFALFSLPLDADDDSSNDLYPPGLNTTIVLLPIFRFLYGKARRNVRSFVFARSRQLEAPPAVEVGPPPIVEVVMPEGQPVPEAAAAGEAPREDPLPDIHISVRQIARLAIGALAFPLLSSTMGNALLYLATPLDAHHSQPLPKAGWLRIGLGLGEPEVFRAAMGWPMLPGKMPSKGWLSMGAVAVGPLFPTRIDPVWCVFHQCSCVCADEQCRWRNAIGGAVIVVCKDVLGVRRVYCGKNRELTSSHSCSELYSSDDGSTVGIYSLYPCRGTWRWISVGRSRFCTAQCTTLGP